MNIFLLDKDPETCARYHVDKHVVKMILEYAQLLSTAHRLLDGKITEVITDKGRRKKVLSLSDDRESILYKATHANHPSAVWVRESADNYSWLHELLAHLCSEYNYRYDKIHATEMKGVVNCLENLPNNIPHTNGQTKFKLAMPDEYKVMDPVESYRKYYRDGKAHIHNWKNRSVPEWIQD